MDHYPLSRRGYLGAAGVALGAGFAGCTGIGSASDLANSDTFDIGFTFDLSGDGPGEPVTLSLTAGDNQFERTFEPGEEFETEIDSPHGDAEVEVEYGEEVTAELEWSRPGLELHIDLEQTRWDNTAGNVEISFADEELTTAFDATLTLPEATTEITGTDTRTIQAETEYEIDISLIAEDDEVEGGLEVEWDDIDDDEIGDDDDDADDEVDDDEVDDDEIEDDDEDGDEVDDDEIEDDDDD